MVKIAGVLFSLWGSVLSVTPALAVFEEQRHFSTIDEFRKYGELEFRKEYGYGFDIQILYTLNQELSIATLREANAPDDGEEWPVVILWANNKGIVVQRVTRAPVVLKGAAEGLDVMGVQRVLKGYDDREVYAALVNKSRTDLSYSAENIDRLIQECKTINEMYLFSLDRQNMSIHMLTDEPVLLGYTKTCNGKIDKSLTFESKDKTLIIRGNKKLSPAQTAWSGNYSIVANRLLRSDNESDIRKQMKEANTKALEEYKKRNRTSAISILRPLIDYSPDVLDSETVDVYNNYAFFLTREDECDKATPILEKIVKRFPERAVAHLNLADSYADKEKARMHYIKYVQLMESQGKKRLIPERVLRKIEIEK